MENRFKLIHSSNDGKSRAGILRTDRNEIQTPVFMPVGTQATVKAIPHKTLLDFDARIILGNTYHLYLRPGTDIIEHFGGLHKFMNWNNSILTDSGGYQVFSLQDIRKISEDGVEFKSHIDGSKHMFTPEKVVNIQKSLGSDIMMVLDECAPYPADKKYVAESSEMSLRWAERCKIQHKNSYPKYGFNQLLFGIGQGGMHEDLRRNYIEKMVEIGFDGYAIGGLSVGEPNDLMYDITDFSTDFLPSKFPRYLMGVGKPENILEGIDRGIDMFDCVLPTRNARNGQLLTTKGKINIKNSAYKLSDNQIDNNIDSYASKNFSLGYLRHLIISNEIFGLQLASEHNIAFYLWLMRTAREKILKNEFRQWKNEFLETYYNNEEK